MKNIISLWTLLLLTLFLMSSFDFMDYWTIKINGKIIYDSSKDTSYNKKFVYTVSQNRISSQDTLEVEYFTDTPCGDCIYNYFITEYTEKNGEAYEVLGTYLNEQKSLGPKSYKKALTDLTNSGTRGTMKAIFYYQNNSSSTTELLRILAK